MKKIALCVMVAVALASCMSPSVIHGSGREAKGAFDISINYTELSVSNGITVEFVNSSTGEGLITADEEVLEYVSIVEENGRVKVSYEPFISVRSNINTVVTMPLSDRLAQLDVSSAGKVTSARRLLCSSMKIEGSSAAEIGLDMDVQELFINLSSASTFRGNVVARDVDIDLNSASRCDIAGSADYCKVEVGSAANFRGLELVSRRAVVKASSAGNIGISATAELRANASGGGSVSYKGSPAIVRRNTSSGGSIRETM